VLPHVPWGTDSDPRSHLGRGSRLIGGANILFPMQLFQISYFGGLEAVVRSCQWTHSGPRTARDAEVHQAPDENIMHGSSQWVVTL
jgi:hypothetical protein